MSIGSKIRELRDKKHWSQYDLADESKVPRWTIQTIETNRTKKIDYQLLKDIANSLDITVEELTQDESIPVIDPKSKEDIAQNLEQTIIDLQIIIKKIRAL